nr:MAG TPA: hypothetical protein [Caudoviricetes sp.]
MTRSSMVEHSIVNRGVVGSSPTESAMALWYKGNYIRLSIGRFGSIPNRVAVLVA